MESEQVISQNSEEQCYASTEEYFLDCCRYNDENEAVDCMKEGVDIYWFDQNLNNCLHMASANGHLNIIEKIFEFLKELKTEQEKINLFLNQQNSDGNTPLHWAVINNQKEVVKFLIKEKANCDLKNLIGSTALDEALNLELSDLIEILARNTKPDPEDFEQGNQENYQVPITKEDMEDIQEIEDTNEEK